MKASCRPGVVPCSAAAEAARPGAPGGARHRVERIGALRLGAALALLGAACAAGAAHERRLEGLQTALRGVEASGAASCAPRELAVARSHLEFAGLEREQGFASRAEAHLDVAEENVRAAGVLAASARCSALRDAGAPPGEATDVSGAAAN
jgi:OOP family OmpA-OmpF porin